MRILAAPPFPDDGRLVCGQRRCARDRPADAARAPPPPAQFQVASAKGAEISARSSRCREETRLDDPKPPAFGKLAHARECRHYPAAPDSSGHIPNGPACDAGDQVTQMVFSPRTTRVPGAPGQVLGSGLPNGAVLSGLGTVRCRRRASLSVTPVWLRCLGDVQRGALSFSGPVGGRWPFILRGMRR